MNLTWLIFPVITTAYVVLLILYFLRRTKHHQSQLETFLKSAKGQIDLHKKEAEKTANLKVAKAATIVQKVQEATLAFEEQAQAEYEQIIKDAKDERREILSSAKSEIEELFAQAEQELETYRQARHQEIERNLVKMVMSITEKVTEMSLSPEDHQHLIKQALEEIKQNRSRS